MPPLLLEHHVGAMPLVGSLRTLPGWGAGGPCWVPVLWVGALQGAGGQGAMGLCRERGFF